MQRAFGNPPETPVLSDYTLKQVARQMHDCALTLHSDLKVVYQQFKTYTANLYQLLTLEWLDESGHTKVMAALNRHRVLENFLSQLLCEVWKFQRTLSQPSSRKTDYGMLLLYESRLHGFYQDTSILEGALARFESEYLDCFAQKESVL